MDDHDLPHETFETTGHGCGQKYGVRILEWDIHAYGSMFEWGTG